MGAILACDRLVFRRSIGVTRVTAPGTVEAGAVDLALPLVEIRQELIGLGMSRVGGEDPQGLVHTFSLLSVIEHPPGELGLPPEVVRRECETGLDRVETNLVVPESIGGLPFSLRLRLSSQAGE